MREHKTINIQNNMNFLTSLRGVAAFLVLLFHLKDQMNDYSALRAFSFLYSKGYLAVDFFFILSGFIISFSYYNTLSTNLSFKNIINFIVKRLARIFPLHFFVMCLFLIFPIALFISGRPVNIDYHNPESFFYKVMLLDLWLVNTENWNSWNVPSWTISGEWFAYLLFPFFIFFFPKNKVAALVLFPFLVVMLGFWYEYFGFSTIGEGIGTLGLMRCLGGFLIGSCVYFFLLNLDKKVKKTTGAISLTLSICITILLGIYFEKNHFFIPICFSWILLSFLISDTWLHKVLNKKWLIYLGDISYSLYLVHMFVITIYATLFWENDLKASILDLLIIIIACFVISHFTFKYIENPCRVFITKKLLRN
jgi:peptidoglycan/LPS O-acetylase OafA/YrhL